nr:tetracycline resistance protein [Allofustis seminis]
MVVPPKGHKNPSDKYSYHWDFYA